MINSVEGLPKIAKDRNDMGGNNSIIPAQGEFGK